MARPLTDAEALDWVFDRPRTAKLGIVLASGAPLVAPVWVARDGEDLVFNTDRNSAKGRALARDERVSLCFDDEAPPFGFVTVAGVATVSEDLADVRRWAATIGGRYMGAEQADAYGERNGVPGELLVRVAPTKITGVLDIAD